MRKIFIGNLSYSTDEASLRELLRPIGAIEGIEIVRDRQTGNHRGFGFAKMVTEEDAAAVVEELHGREVAGRKLRVEIATERAEPVRRGARR